MATPGSVSIYQKALIPPSQSPNPQALQNTLSGQAITSIDPSNPAMQPFDENIQKAHKQLEDLLNQYPDINYQEKYKGILDEIQNRPVPQAPASTPGGALAAFAANMGSPRTAPALLQDQIQRTAQMQDQKQKDLMTMKEALLHGAIQEAVAKGNFQMAIKHSEALDDLQRADADRTRALNTQQWFAQQAQRSQDARSLLATKIRTLAAANFHLGEKEQLELLNKGLAYRQQLQKEPGIVPGTSRYSDAEIDMMTDQYLEDQSRIYGAVTGKTPPKGKDDNAPPAGGATGGATGGAPAPGTPAATAAGQAALARFRAGAAGKAPTTK